MEYYNSWMKRLRNHAEKAAVFPILNDALPLPRVPNPGDEWCGLIPQKRIDKEIDLEEMSQTGHLMIWISRSDRQKALKKRLSIVAKTFDF